MTPRPQQGARELAHAQRRRRSVRPAEQTGEIRVTVMAAQL